MAKPLTFMEQLVGRRCPPHPKHRDTVLARFVDDAGNPVVVFEPSENHLRKPFLEAKRKGLLKLVDSWSIMGGRASGRYTASERGLEEIRAARTRFKAATEARRLWGADAVKAAKAHRHAAAAAKETESDVGEAPEISGP